MLQKNLYYIVNNTALSIQRLILKEIILNYIFVSMLWQPKLTMFFAVHSKNETYVSSSEGERVEIESITGSLGLYYSLN